MSLTVSVCITTHNRRDELARTLSMLGKLNPAPDEILVAVDGCEHEPPPTTMDAFHREAVEAFIGKRRPVFVGR